MAVLEDTGARSWSGSYPFPLEGTARKALPRPFRMYNSRQRGKLRAADSGTYHSQRLDDS